LLRLVFLLAVYTIVAAHGPAGHDDRTTAGHYDGIPHSGQQTHAPSQPDGDAVWQSATRNATTNGSSSQFGKHHARIATLSQHRVRALAGSERARELCDAARDRSPLHSIPLLI
jgi:hypothetical protein